MVETAVISVGYRPAPKHPFLEHSEDGYDAAEWLLDNPKARFGAPLKFAASEVPLPTYTTLLLKSADHMKSVGPISLRSLLFIS